jgi:hypothetical protein
MRGVGNTAPTACGQSHAGGRVSGEYHLAQTHHELHRQAGPVLVRRERGADMNIVISTARLSCLLTGTG